MNYIYDVTLNFNDEFYEFYEWKQDDNPDFVLKIPVFKIDEETFYDLRYNLVEISKEILNKIDNETEIFKPNTLKIIKYSALFVCDEMTMAIIFDSNGKNILKSSISPDEEEDVLEFTRTLKYSIVDYKIKEKNSINCDFYTRSQKDLSKSLENKLNLIYKNGENDKLNYIFYEIFNTKSSSLNTSYFKLLHVIKQKSKLMYKIHDIFGIIENEKIVNKNS